MNQEMAIQTNDLTPEEHYWPYFKPSIDINNVIDHAFYSEKGLNGFLFQMQQFDLALNVFTPPLMLNDFWVTLDKYSELNETSKTLQLTFQSYPVWKAT